MGEKILILSFSGIGNSLMAIPFINCLKQRLNPAQIDILCLNKTIAETFTVAFNEGKIISLSGNILRDLSKIIGLRREKYDFCITLFPSNKWQFDLIAFLSGAKKRVCHIYRAARFSAFLQNIKIPAESGLHDVEQNLRLLEAFGLNAESSSRGFDFHLGEEDKKFAENFIAANIPEKSFLVGIHPGAGSEYGGQNWQGRSKRWS